MTYMLRRGAYLEKLARDPRTALKALTLADIEFGDHNDGGGDNDDDDNPSPVSAESVRAAVVEALGDLPSLMGKALASRAGKSPPGHTSGPGPEPVPGATATCAAEPGRAVGAAVRPGAGADAALPADRPAVPVTDNPTPVEPDAPVGVCPVHMGNGHANPSAPGEGGGDPCPEPSCAPGGPPGSDPSSPAQSANTMVVYADPPDSGNPQIDHHLESLAPPAMPEMASLIKTVYDSVVGSPVDAFTAMVCDEAAVYAMTTQEIARSCQVIHSEYTPLERVTSDHAVTRLVLADQRMECIANARRLFSRRMRPRVLREHLDQMVGASVEAIEALVARAGPSSLTVLPEALRRESDREAAFRDLYSGEIACLTQEVEAQWGCALTEVESWCREERINLRLQFTCPRDPAARAEANTFRKITSRRRELSRELDELARRRRASSDHIAKLMLMRAKLSRMTQNGSVAAPAAPTVVSGAASTAGSVGDVPTCPEPKEGARP